MEKIIPDKWVFLEMTDASGACTRRVLSGFSDQTWSLSGPVTESSNESGVFTFKTSNQEYLCHGSRFGFTDLSRTGYDSLKNRNPNTKLIVFDDPT